MYDLLCSGLVFTILINKYLSKLTIIYFYSSVCKYLVKVVVVVVVEVEVVVVVVVCILPTSMYITY